MQPLPHHYAVSTVARPSQEIVLSGRGLPPLQTETPPEFSGPGGSWSPESMLVGAVTSCFVLTFRGLATARGLRWNTIACDVHGTLERVDGVTRFTEFDLNVTLHVPASTNPEQAEQILERAETTCLIARSLNAVSHLRLRVVHGDAPIEAPAIDAHDGVPV